MVANRTKSDRLQELAERRTGKDRRQTARRAVDAAKSSASVFLPKSSTESSAIPNRRLRGKRRKTSRRGNA